jgi:hypothetical protein
MTPIESSPAIKKNLKFYVDCMSLSFHGGSPYSGLTTNLNKMVLQHGAIYRIEVFPTHVSVDWYNVEENFSPALKRGYDNVNDLPKWAQKKLAVLMVLDPDNINEPIDEVGRRISKNIYWIFKGEDDEQ